MRKTQGIAVKDITTYYEASRIYCVVLASEQPRRPMKHTSQQCAAVRGRPEALGTWSRCDLQLRAGDLEFVCRALRQARPTAHLAHVSTLCCIRI